MLGLLVESLRQGHPPEGWDCGSLSNLPDVDYAISRFLKAWCSSGQLGADQVVLLRQVLQWSRMLDLPFPSSLGNQSGVRQSVEKAGLELSETARISAVPFGPGWSLDAAGCDAPPSHREIDETLQAESYLSSLGYSRWRSQAQKEASWAVLNTLPGETKTIVLPTGSGKSLCFQLLPRFSSGLTVVVVPTIALAIDQHAIAAERLGNLPGVNPRYFASDDEPDVVAQQVKERKTRIVFTSPEACVSGRLRPILDTCAQDGWLQHLVIDEAHLIETWGANFRVEFQVLASARRKWLAATSGQLRTYLFSATMTPECRGTLSQLFAERDGANEFVCQRLRPEIRYYNSTFRTQEERRAAVLETLWHLPRPVILYVTEKVEAERFSSILREEGFRRLGCFHGDIRNAERRNLLRQWKGNEIDLMVATSAFGVGVDKPDIRAVVHACFPENLDRYYQEVGRGGRDGWAAVSFLMPTLQDRRVAEGISVRLMTPELIQKRWEAMFCMAEMMDTYVYSVPVESRRSELVGTRTYSENVRWNKRLLLQLQRAGMIEVLDLQLRESRSELEDREEWAEIRINFPANSTRLQELIAPQREEELIYFRQGLQRIDKFILNERCAAREFADLYKLNSNQRACPGCSWCRANGNEPASVEPLEFPLVKPRVTVHSSEIVDGCPSPIESTNEWEFINFIFRLVTSSQLREFMCDVEHYARVAVLFERAFPSNDPAIYRLDQFSNTAQLSKGRKEPFVLLHIGRCSDSGLLIGQGYEAIHMLCGVKDQNDINGRHLAVNLGCRYWPSLEAWWTEGRARQR